MCACGACGIRCGRVKTAFRLFFLNQGSPLLPMPLRVACAVLFVGSVAGVCPVRASASADAVRAKLVKAKSEYDAEVQKFDTAVRGCSTRARRRPARSGTSRRWTR